MTNHDLLKSINGSFKKFTGYNLPAPVTPLNLLNWLDQEAPYSLLAHDTDPDPKFIYANAHALQSFGYSLDEILNLKSKLSTSEIDRSERQILLELVKKNGIANNYTGLRVRKEGHFFTIHHGIVWEISDEHQKKIGQAALFWLNNDLPHWFNVEIRQT